MMMSINLLIISNSLMSSLGCARGGADFRPFCPCPAPLRIVKITPANRTKKKRRIRAVWGDAGQEVRVGRGGTGQDGFNT